MEQVAADLGMELVFSEKGVPRGRGKVERFFRSVDQLFLQDVPGYAPKGYGEAEATLTLPAFEQRFRTWLLSDYHHCQGRWNREPIENWPPGNNELQRTTIQNAGAPTPTITRQDHLTPTLTSRAPVDRAPVVLGASSGKAASPICSACRSFMR